MGKKRVPKCQTTGKTRFSQEIDAKIFLAKTHKRDDPTRIKSLKRAYLCQFCHGWHLTSKEDYNQRSV